MKRLCHLQSFLFGICGVFRRGDPLGVCGTVTFVWSIFHMPLASTDKSNHTTPKIRKAVQNTNKVNHEFLSSQKRLKKKKSINHHVMTI